MTAIRGLSLILLAILPCFALPAYGQALADSTKAVAGQAETLVLKRKIAIERFTNSTRYGRALLLPGELDPVETQVTDILMGRLIESNAFILFEAPKSNVMQNGESGTKPKGQAFLDSIVVGSVTELGRRAEGRAGFLNSTVRQIATAKVEIRLVDPKTGQAFFTTSGTGASQLEAKEVAGFGSVASYDSALIDRALAAAIADVATNVIQKLSSKTWETSVLSISGPEVFISGGPAQRLQVGQKLRVDEAGRAVMSAQTGTIITLPGKYLGTIEIKSFFGDTPETEGSIASVVDGNLGSTPISNLVVKEIKP